MQVILTQLDPETTDQLAGSALTLSTSWGTGSLCQPAEVTSSHHEGNKAAVAPAAPLVVIPRPHDLDTGQGPKAPKLLLQDLLIQIWGQITCSAAVRSEHTPAAQFSVMPLSCLRCDRLLLAME